MVPVPFIKSSPRHCFVPLSKVSGLSTCGLISILYSFPLIYLSALNPLWYYFDYWFLKWFLKSDHFISPILPSSKSFGYSMSFEFLYDVTISCQFLHKPADILNGLRPIHRSIWGELILTILKLLTYEQSIYLRSFKFLLISLSNILSLSRWWFITYLLSFTPSISYIHTIVNGIFFKFYFLIVHC